MAAEFATSQSKPHLLSRTEIDSYRRNGYVTPNYRLPPDVLASLKSAVDSLIETNPDIRPEQLVGAHIKSSKDTGVRGREELFNFTRFPELLDIVEQVIGPDIVMWGSQVFSKPAGDGMAIPWHQDGQYWPMKPLATVTVWVAIDRASVSNGCLRVIPGSHKAGLMPHESTSAGGLALNQGLAAKIDEESAVNIELEPGQVSLHDVMLVHGSNANRSGARRCGYAIRYMPATSHFDRTLVPTRIANNQVIDFSQRPIWLLRGQDRANNDYTIGH
jgi:hypothetical protein